MKNNFQDIKKIIIIFFIKKLFMGVMGVLDSIFESCTDDKNENGNNIVGNHNLLEEDSEFGLVKMTSKNCYRFASEIQNMKLHTNLIIQIKANPWLIYSEIKDLGFGSYGIVKKVYLKSNPVTISAIKKFQKEF